MIAALALLAWVYLLAWHRRFWQSGPELHPAAPQLHVLRRSHQQHVTLVHLDGGNGSGGQRLSELLLKRRPLVPAVVSKVAHTVQDSRQ